MYEIWRAGMGGVVRENLKQMWIGRLRRFLAIDLRAMPLVWFGRRGDFDLKHDDDRDLRLARFIESGNPNWRGRGQVFDDVNDGRRFFLVLRV